MRHIVTLIFSFVFALALPAQQAQGWLTCDYHRMYLSSTGVQSMQDGTGSHSRKITVNPSVRYQSVEGFGWMLTQGSAKLLMEMSASARTALLQELYAPDGKVRATVVRIAVGACDLSESDYTYSMSKDESLSNFSLSGPDQTDLIPVLQEILAINPNVFIMAAPWTAPVWMKQNAGAHGGYSAGSLKTQYYGLYATYLLRYLQAMTDQGITVHALSIQNEPLNNGNNPSMYWSKEQMYDFAQNHLGPTLAQNGYGNVLIIGYDHNCDNTEYPIHVAQSRYVSGTAFHLYSGDISALTTVHNTTGKDVWFTEQYTGENGSFQGDFGWHMQNVMLGAMQNHARAAIEWNLANDPLYNLHTDGGCSSCKGALTMQNGTIQSRNVSYYIVAQMSRVVQRGAVRVASSGASDINHCAFVNPDGSIGVVMYNNHNDDRTVDVVYNNQHASFTVHGNGATSVMLYEAGAVVPPEPPIVQQGVSIHVTSAPAGTDSIYLIGSWGHSWWLSENIPCERLNDGTWQALVPEFSAFEYKCWNRWRVNGQETWEYEEAIDANGTLRPQNRTANYNVSQNEEIQVLFWRKQAAYVDWPVEGIENTPTDGRHHKVLHNGILLIHSNGIDYDVTGRKYNKHQ